MHAPSRENDFQSGHAMLLARSFERQLQRRLHTNCAAQALYQAPFPILSHDGAEDPLLTYGNLSAQNLWGMSWQSLTGMPSRLTAEPAHRNTRAAMFDEMRAKGFIENYHGVRISASGQRFEIRNAVIWPLIDDNGVKRGEAATFREFVFL